MNSQNHPGIQQEGENMAKLRGVGVVELLAVETDNLDTKCYRGSAQLAHLALISQADVFDQVTNPNGLQRDLSPKHASDAYEYVNAAPKDGLPRAFPEVVLNVRDKKFVEITPLEDVEIEGLPVFRLRFDLDRLKGGKVQVSRV